MEMPTVRRVPPRRVRRREKCGPGGLFCAAVLAADWLTPAKESGCVDKPGACQNLASASALLALESGCLAPRAGYTQAGRECR